MQNPHMTFESRERRLSTSFHLWFGDPRTSGEKSPVFCYTSMIKAVIYNVFFRAAGRPPCGSVERLGGNREVLAMNRSHSIVPAAGEHVRSVEIRLLK